MLVFVGKCSCGAVPLLVALCALFIHRRLMIRGHTFVAEIDRRDSRGQERLRWRAPVANVPETMDPDRRSDDSGGGSSGIMQYTRKYVGGAVMQARQPVAKQFMQFLDTHLSPTPPPERQVGTNPASLLSPSSATVEATAAADPVKLGIHEPPKPSDGLASRGYSVEMYQPGGRGWMPLTDDTPDASIPTNCRIHVIVSCSTSTSQTAASQATGASEPVEHRRSPSSGQEILALPWRRFDVGDEGGMEVCGRKLRIQDVPNSDQGTGLFTWDGAVLLAKYIEHQRGVFLQDHHHPPPPSTAANGDEDSCNSTPVQGPHQKKQHKPLRVLELGCGTGFAGIAAALSLGSDPGTASAGGQGIARVISGTGACSDSISEDSSTAKPDPCTDGGVTPPISPTFLHGRDSAANQRTTQIGPPARKDRASVFRERSCENSSKGGRIGLAVGDGRLLESAPDSSPDFTHTECGVYVVLTDLGYALGNARSNIEQNRSSIAHRGARVVAAQLDWTKPVPPELVEDGEFDLILAADVVWLDELVKPLVNTLEHLTAGWCNCSAGGEKPRTGDATSWDGVGGSGRRRRRKIIFAYQWRSERTGRSLLRELDRCFEVREIPSQECHPDYAPSNSLVLFEVTRREACDG